MKERISHGPLSTEQLFRSHAPFVARFLRRLGVADHALDDAVQEVFLVVHRSGGYAEGAAKPTSYLGSIAMRAAANHRRRVRTATARTADDEVEVIAACTPDPLQDVETSERMRTFESALSRLDDTLRTTLLLADGEGETCVAIAAAMDVPVGTVYWRLDRARKKFRAALRAVQAGADIQVYTETQARRRSGASAWVLGLFGQDFRLPSSPERVLTRLASTVDDVAYDVAAGLARHRAVVDAALTRGTTSTPIRSATLPRLHGTTASSLTMLGAGALSLVVVATVAWPRTAPAGAETANDRPSGTPSNALANATPQVDSATSLTATVTALPSVSRHESGDDASVGERADDERVVLPRRAKSERARVRRSDSRSVGAGSGRATAASTSHAGAHDADVTPVVEDALGAQVEEPLGAPAPQHAASSEPAAQAQAASARKLVEALEIGRAERLLTSDPDEALSVVRRLAKHSEPAYLREERDYVEVIALARSGRAAIAREQASAFLRRYPDSAFTPKVRAAMQELTAQR